MWVIVRPKPKLMQSVNYFNTHGFPITGFAPIDIKTNIEAISALNNALVGTSVDSLIVTSTESVSRLKPLLTAKQSGLKCYCIGSSSAALLIETDLQCMVPNPQNSEGIINLPSLQQVRDQHFALVKGVGGRELIADTLRSRGAQVSEFDVYQRILLTNPVCSSPIDWDQVTGLLVSSRALVDAVVGSVGLDLLKNKVWVGVSNRVSEHGRAIGIKEFHSSDGASDAHLLGWLNRQGRGQT